MASTAISSDNPVVIKHWDEMEFREVNKEMYIQKFMGKSSDSLIFEKTKLLKDQGDKITFTIFPRQAAQVVKGSSGQSLEGKEGTIKSFTDYVNLEEYKMAFKWNEGLDSQRPWFTISEQAAKGLAQVSAETLDDLWFAEMQGISDDPLAPSHKIYGGGKGSIAALDANSKLTPQLIRRCKALANSGFANGSNARRTYPFQPVKVNGKNYLIFLTHDYAVYDLQNNAEYQGYIKEAERRGPENPIFTGAVAIINNVIIHTHENMQILPHPSTPGLYYCTSLLLGAGSSIWAWGKRPETVKKEFGYKEAYGLGRKFIAKAKKTQFKFTASGSKEDYGSAMVYVTVTNVAEAE